MTEKSFWKILELDSIVKEKEINLVLNKYFNQSTLLAEINNAQEIIIRRHLEHFLFEEKKESFSFKILWNKLKLKFLKQSNPSNNKLALLNFDIDFLLDLLLFRIK
jgi:hypothetical protein